MHVVLFYNHSCSVCQKYLATDFPVAVSILSPYATVYKMEIDPKSSKDIQVLAAFSPNKDAQGMVPQVALFSRHGQHIVTGLGPVSPLVLLKKVSTSCMDASASSFSSKA